MKYLHLFLISIIFLIPYKLFATVADTTQKERQFTKAELVADVNYLVKTIADVHPNMYHSINKKRYESLTKSIISQLHDGMTEKQAWSVMAPLIGTLNEGHSNFNYPNDLLSGLKTGKDLLFPVVLREFDGQYLIVRIDGSAEDMLLPGDKVISINGIKAPQLVDSLSTCSGGLRSWRANDVCRNIIVYMFMYNIKAPYHITYLRGDKVDSTVLRPVAFADYASRIKTKAAKQPAQPSPGNYSFSSLGNGKVLLTVNSLAGDPGGFKHFLDSAFTSFKQTNANTLIVDLRRNGGGNSALGETLLGYITDKPFRMTGGVKWKISEEYKAQIRKNADSAALKNMAYYLDGKNGTIIENNGPKPEKPADNNLLFKGKVFVLIGAKTFSSANMLANTIQDYKLATLVGEPSGEPANDYGELLFVKLPNTGFTFTTSVKQFIRANGNANDDHTVLPDHLVKDNPATPADEVLEYVKKL
ncbi:MAG TPA: S41 family peptidase [Mucilaginibacter sp.]